MAEFLQFSDSTKNLTRMKDYAIIFIGKHWISYGNWLPEKGGRDGITVQLVMYIDRYHAFQIAVKAGEHPDRTIGELWELTHGKNSRGVPLSQRKKSQETLCQLCQPLAEN